MRWALSHVVIMPCHFLLSKVYTDPATGEKKNKHKLGGAYPGNRRNPQQQYAPTASEFQNGQAMAHFVNYGGGNALVLQQNGIAQPQAGEPVGKKPTFIQGKRASEKPINS